jgi:hypothetical protein
MAVVTTHRVFAAGHRLTVTSDEIPVCAPAHIALRLCTAHAFSAKRPDDSTVRESINRQRPSEKNHCDINGPDDSDGSDGTFHDGGALPEGQVEVEV